MRTPSLFYSLGNPAGPWQSQSYSPGHGLSGLVSARAKTKAVHSTGGRGLTHPGGRSRRPRKLTTRNKNLERLLGLFPGNSTSVWTKRREGFCRVQGLQGGHRQAVSLV